MDINITNPVTTSKIGEVVNGASAATPNDTDLLPVVESSVTKKLTLTNLKAFLKTYFDTLYSNLGYTAENVANKSSSYTTSSTTTYANTKALVDGLATKEPLKGADDNYVTDAQLTVIGNTSGTNSGDNATNTTSNAYADGKISQVITNGVTDKAPCEDAVFDALALKQNIVSGVDDTEIGYLNGVTSSIQTQLDSKVYTIQGYSATTAFNPADSTTYYWGGAIINTIATVATTRRYYIPKTGTLVGCIVTFEHSGSGSAETSSIYTRLNDTTDITISSAVVNNTPVATFSNFGLSQAVTQGTDYINVKWVTPAWTSNPTGIIVMVTWIIKAS